MAAIKQRLLALSSVAVTIFAYANFFPSIMGESYLWVIPLLASVVNPASALPAFLLVFFLELYRSSKLFLLLAVLPFMLLYLVKNVHDWRSALALLMFPPIVILFPWSMGVVLGLLYYLSSKEKVHESFFSAAIFLINLTVMSLLFVRSSIFWSPPLVFPGGFPRSSRGEIVDAVSFYSSLVNLFWSNIVFLVEFFVFVLSMIVSSLSEEPRLIKIVMPQLLLILIPILANVSITQRDLLAILASLSTTTSAYYLDRISFKIPSLFFKLKRGFLRENRSRRELDDLQIIFSDLNEIISQIILLCNESNPNKKIVILGLTYDEEESFLRYLMLGRKCKAKILLYHRLGLDGLRSLNPSDTLIVYIRVIDIASALAILSKITGFDIETLEKLSLPYRKILTRLSRTTLLRLGRTIDEKIRQGASARKAFDSTFRRAVPELNEDHIKTLEQVFMDFEVIGFTR
ncbi:MAG: hypothetical protein ACP5GL_07010 [Infirmifilum sp.]